MKNADENTVPSPAKKKYKVRLWNEVEDGWVMSSGVFAISNENNPNPVENRMAATSEHDHGPYRSIIFPTKAANGYWPIMPLYTTLVEGWRIAFENLRQHYRRQLRLREFQVRC